MNIELESMLKKIFNSNLFIIVGCFCFAAALRFCTYQKASHDAPSSLQTVEILEGKIRDKERLIDSLQGCLSQREARVETLRIERIRIIDKSQEKLDSLMSLSSDSLGSWIHQYLKNYE